ncbi:hypothetical protein VNO80_19814 [Phaseolus coccineus]|uniref:Uncharacterized protein n=1 Tax=Phaseolus coccineus TaxID=3886 RepID=A0AAN9MK91_PHACN
MFASDCDGLSEEVNWMGTSSHAHGTVGAEGLPLDHLGCGNFEMREVPKRKQMRLYLSGVPCTYGVFQNFAAFSILKIGKDIVLDESIADEIEKGRGARHKYVEEFGS